MLKTPLTVSSWKNLVDWRTPVLVLSLAILSGCPPEANTSGTLPASSGEDAEHDHDHDHHHPEHGPHGGELVELGNEEYHAEIVHKDGSVTIYVLDGKAEATVPITAPEVILNLTLPGGPKQFSLAAQPADGETGGSSSRFVSQDAELNEQLDKEGVEARLSLTIDGKSYSGKVEEHHHDH